MTKNLKNRIISALLIFVLLLMQISVSANSGAFEVTFDGTNMSEKLKNWKLPDNYTVTDEGIQTENKNSLLMYEGEKFANKYEYSVDFRLPYVSSAEFLFNYQDNKNYQAVAINPQFSQIIMQNMKDGYLSGIKEVKFDFAIDATKWYNIRIISNGGEGVSVYISDDTKTYTIFEDCYIEKPTSQGYIGFNSKSNTLNIKRISVLSIGEKDFVKPSEPNATEAPAEENLTEKEYTDGIYDEKILKLVMTLGVIPESYAERGWSYVTADEFKEIMSRLYVNTAGGAEKVSLSDGYDAILTALGYNKFASSAYGRMKQDVKNRLRDDMKINETDYMVFHDLARLIYNALEEKVLIIQSSYGKQVEYGTEDGRTLLSEVLDTYIVEGQVTDNYLSAVDGKTDFGKPMLKIGNESIGYNADLHNMYTYLGRYVKAYYEKTDYDENGKILWIEYDKREEVLEIEAEDFVAYENYSIKYSIDGKSKTVKFKQASKVIYNGSAVASYTNELFDIENGTIKLVKFKDAYDTVIITEYEDFVVNSVNTEEQKVYSKVNYRYNKNNSFMMDISQFEKYEIYDTEGKRMTPEELQPDDILSVIRNDEFALITVSRNIMTFFDIETVRRENGKLIIEGGNGAVTVNEYDIAPYCTDSDMIKSFTAGQTVNLYVNAFGRGVWAKFIRSQESFVGCLTKAVIEESDEVTICVFQTDGMQIKYSVANKVTFLDETGKKQRITEKELYERLKGKNTIITFFINDRDEIYNLEVPRNEFSATDDNGVCVLADDSLTFGTGNLSFGNFFCADDIKVFTVKYDEREQMNRYTMTSVWNLLNATSVKGLYFGTDNDVYINYAILYDIEKNSFPKHNVKPAVITDICTAIYDDEVCTKITAFNGSNVTLYAEPEVVNSVSSPFGYKDGEAVQTYPLQKGDIIRYSTDMVTGKLKTVLLIYRANDINPISGAKGWITDSLGTKMDDNGKSNPYQYSAASDGEHLSFSKNPLASSFDSYSAYRVTYGSVFRKVNEIVELTTEDLSVRSGAYEPIDSDNYLTLRRKMTSGVHVKLVNDGNVVIADTAKMANIKSYEEVGSGCTKFLLLQNNGSNLLFFIDSDN